jgi:hypothetical protein
MLSAIEANPIGFLLHCKDTCQVAVAAAEENLIEEVEDGAENTHGSLSLPFRSLYR